MSWWNTPYVEMGSDVCIMEICPVNDKVCKVVYSNRIVEYIRKGSVFKYDHHGIYDEYYDELTLTVTGFDYNELTINAVSRRLENNEKPDFER